MKSAAHIEPFNLRRMRATSMVAMLLRELDDLPGVRENRRDIAERLYRALHDAGVDFITDADRAAVGLPPRGELGWTDSELHALETARMSRLLAPFGGQPFVKETDE